MEVPDETKPFGSFAVATSSLITVRDMRESFGNQISQCVWRPLNMRYVQLLGRPNEQQTVNAGFPSRFDLSLWIDFK